MGFQFVTDVLRQIPADVFPIPYHSRIAAFEHVDSLREAILNLQNEFDKVKQ
ncbi:MAG: hypothetical protein INQ03_08965 [Candidatus Heimdallarchaeota archaeon]|nr:hypothetical protein [Candidatus Heimdallarchaeota archaeon]